MHSILRRFWPPEGQILLLRAALADVETARRAWREWDARQELADAASPEVRLLAAVAGRMPELAPGVPLDPRLAGARRYIWTLTQTTLATTRPLLAAMQAEGLRLMLIKGAARLSSDPRLAQERALRDIDVLLHPDDWGRGLAIVRREGWTEKDASIDIDPSRQVHALGLRSPLPGARGEFDLHRYVLRECRNVGQDSGLWERAQPVHFLGVDVLRPSDTDFAMVTLAQSMLYSARPQPAHWALDIDSLVRTGKIDWNLLLREVHSRKIEMYVAAPLLMARECIGCPVPPEVLRDLTGRVGKPALVEFETRASGYGPKLPEQFEACRIMAASRAMHMARAHSYVASAGGKVTPLPVRLAKLRPDEYLTIPVPTGGGPLARERLYITFDVHHARGHAYLRVEGSGGVPLKMIPIDRASKKRGGRVRRQIMMQCPSCLFTLRGADRVRVRTNDRLEIHNVVLSWGRPAAQDPLVKLATVLRRWRDRVRRSSAA